MRPYLAIIRDSFHEALVSRLLWLLLILITLLLLVLTPLGLHEQSGSLFDGTEFVDLPSLGRKLSTAGTAAADSVSKRLWTRLDSGLRERLAAPASSSKQPLDALTFQANLTATLNRLLADADLFDQPEKMNLFLSRECRQLYDRGLDKLPADDLARYNRLVIDQVFTGDIVPARPLQLSVAYFGADWFGPFPIGRSEFVNTAFWWVMYLVQGVAGVFVAILVTSSIVPQTFEAGAIDLLLSKPISRSLVFLTKFTGGCAFILLNTTYLLGGLWLLMGLRLGVWNHRTLLCIPIYLFLFSIYYGVSALAGLIWRNAIISVALTVLYWACCFAIAFFAPFLHAFCATSVNVIKLVPTDNDVLTVNEPGEVARWSTTRGDWEHVFVAPLENDPMMMFRGAGGLLGPVYDPHSKRLLAGELPLAQFAAMSANSPLLIGKPETNWQRTKSLTMPPGAEAMFVDRGGKLLVVTPRGISRLEGNPEEPPKPMRAFGFELPMDAKDRRFFEAGPLLGLRTSFSASFDQNNSTMAIYDGRRLIVLEPDSPAKFRLRKEEILDPAQAGVVAVSGSTLLLALADGQIRLMDPTTLAVRRTVTAAGKSTPRFALASPDGRRFAVLFHNGRLWMYDAQADREIDVRATGQGDISAVAFNGPNRVLLADRLTRVIEYQLDDWKEIKRYEPQLTWTQTAFRYGFNPLARVFPKPSELDKAIGYLLTGETSKATTARRDDLTAARETIDIWGPVRTNLIFLAIMLTIGCVYVARKDF